jgi:hypothetical protein
VGFRLLAAMPPIFGAWFVKDLGVITNFTGIIAFLITFTFPALLQRKSRLYARQCGMGEAKVKKTITKAFFLIILSLGSPSILITIFGAWFVKDLGVITSFTGIIAFLITFTFPALLQRKSRLYAKQCGMGDAKVKTHGAVTKS